MALVELGVRDIHGNTPGLRDRGPQFSEPPVRHREGLTIEQAFENFRKPDGMDSAEWEKRLSVVSRLAEMGAAPTNVITTSTFGENVPSTYRISRGPNNSLQRAVSIGYAPTWEYIAVYARQGSESFHPLAPLLEAENEVDRVQALSVIEKGITVASDVRRRVTGADVYIGPHKRVA